MKFWLQIFIVWVGAHCSATHARRAEMWSGHYEHENGMYQMDIDAFDSVQLKINITKKSDKRWVDKFMAFADGRTAKHSDIQEPKRCWIEFKREEKGVVVEDHCSGPKDESGLYKFVK
ncbi:MAG: hypothetical protein HYR96_02995 [Deltaproteobacteria bacterium]|nr:hypothetical protein [Deltaproteobacteria bacterium]MBI3294066.1 hypothetical protein [Deltaproteobacteria bacterium]